MTVYFLEYPPFGFDSWDCDQTKWDFDKLYEIPDHQRMGLTLVCENVAVLPTIPDCVKYICFESCGQMVLKETLPSCFNGVYLIGDLPDNIFENLPKNIEILCLKGFWNDTLPVLPDTLTTIWFEQCRIRLPSTYPKEFNNITIINSTIIGNTTLPSPDFIIEKTTFDGDLKIVSAAQYSSMEKVTVAGCLKLLCDFDYLVDITCSSIDTSQSRLKELDLGNISTSTLLSLPDTLEKLECVKSDITELPTLPHGLKELNVSCTGIKKLPQLPSTLEVLLCDNSHITELPTLPPLLKKLFCFNSGLGSLPALPRSLEFLDVAGTIVERIPPIPSTLKHLDVGDSRVKYISSKVPASCCIDGIEHKMIKWCFGDDKERFEVCDYSRKRYAKCLRVASKVIARRIAASVIQRNLKNWLYKPICADGRLGIIPRLGIKQTSGLSVAPLIMDHLV